MMSPATECADAGAIPWPIKPEPDFEVIVIGAGVAGIYQIKRLVDLGVSATVLEAAPDLGRHLVQ